MRPLSSDYGDVRSISCAALRNAVWRVTTRLRATRFTGYAPGSGASPPRDILGDMTIRRMDNVGIVVDDLDAAIAFFTELGMELEGRMPIEGSWAGNVVGLDDMRSEIAMMRIPDAPGRIELAKYHAPKAIIPKPEISPANTLGLHRVMFAVDDIGDTLARLRPHGAELVGEVARFENSYLLCYLRGPSGIIVALAEQLH
jgi:catechol 2,3-dioxygenase-like lactoylglutathione lyase family enzyme